jgi:hypothetical protein
MLRFYVAISMQLVIAPTYYKAVPTYQPFIVFI